MRVVVNGEEQNLPGPATVVDLLVHIGLGDTLVAVERNRKIVPRAQHASTAVCDGDCLEIVHFVGGG